MASKSWCRSPAPQSRNVRSRVRCGELSSVLGRVRTGKGNGPTVKINSLTRASCGQAARAAGSMSTGRASSETKPITKA